MFGFTIGGIASVIYEVLFKKKLTDKKDIKLLSQSHLIDAFVMFLLPLIFFGGTLFFGINTLDTSLLGCGVPLLIIYCRRKDLIIDSLISGFSLLLIIFIIYTIVEFLSPGWVIHFWTFKNVPPIIFLNVTIDDLMWYIVVGALIGVIFEFLQESPLFRLDGRSD